MSSSEDCILFEHLVKLLNSISNLQPRRADTQPNANKIPKSLDLVNQWFARVREYYSIVPLHTCKIFFRLFFPEEDIRRRYNLKETTLARSLASDVFGLSSGTHGAGRALIQWSDYPDSVEKAKLGCLGIEVEKVLADRHSIRHGKSPSIQRIDSLLDELASLSGYSSLDNIPVHPKRARAAILRDLFLGLEPVEAKFLTQIILKDLRPVLYPLTETHTTKSLLHYKSNAVHTLTKWEIMKAWHPNMPKIYRARATLDEAARAVEAMPFPTHIPQDHQAFSPVVGVPIEIPKSQKGVKLSHALSFFRGAGDVWAETKYDGERMQIHVDLSLAPSRQITIFSKSKRNSTQDRMGTHPIIRAALGLPPSPQDHLQYPTLSERASSLPGCVHTYVILDAEMVAYSESKGDIDEFWRLRSLIESTAHGIRGAQWHSKRQAGPPESQDSLESGQEESPDVGGSLESNASDNGDRHLKIVFYDILFLDGTSLLDQTYSERRAQLERSIRTIPGFVSLSLRHRISLTPGLPAATKALAQIFSEHIANHQEGLVLKGSASHYNSNSYPWVKLKRDYIPGYGDTIDLAIIGAGWNKERARELRVAPETFTTFFVAALENPMPGSDIARCTPKFQVLFTVEYGMDREQLETFNLYIKTSEPHLFIDKMPSLSYQFEFPQTLAKPAIMFSRPLLAELFGACFTKNAGTKHYSLRFPRITKVWRANERNWAQGSHLEDFQTIARSSIGRESSDEWAIRNVEAMWGCEADPGPNDPRTIEETTKRWHEKLLRLEFAPAANHDRNVPSPSRRKAPPKDIQEPPPKRRKVQTSRAGAQPLRALGSMTNFIRTEHEAQRLVAMPSPPITPAVAPKGPAIQHKGKQDKGIGGVKVNAHHAPITPASPDRPQASLRRASVPLPSAHILFAPSAPQVPSTHTSSKAPKPYKPMSFEEEAEVIRLVQSPSPTGSVTPATSPQATSSAQGRSPEKRDVASLFSDPYWPQKYIHTPIVQFLQDAYVWFATDPDNKRPAGRPPALELIPRNRKIVVMWFLLIICGCDVKDIKRTAEQFTHVNKCVIFVKRPMDLRDQESLDWLFDALDTWRSDLNKPGNKELFVFDSEMVGYESLATFKGDVESQAIWRSSRPVE